MELRRVLANRQHLVECPLLQWRIRGLTGRYAEDIEIVQVGSLSLPQWAKSVGGRFVLICKKVAEPQQIPGLERVRCATQGFGEGFDSGLKVVLAVMSKTDVQ